MAPGCFSAFWCFRGPPSPSNDAVVSPVRAPTGATQPNSASPSDNGGIRNAPAIEIARPGTSPSPGHDIPVPAPIQAVLSPSLTDAQPMSQHGPEGSVDVPVLAHGEGGPPVPSTSRLRLDPAKAREHIDRISRFRILVMGRANAGKTTVLQRVCNTTDQPEIFNGKGEKVDATVVQGSLTRGEHNIEDELVFQSNPRFVFHDSRGFEAGSKKQFDMMKEFVTDRAKRSRLDERIHAIWFCIPLNESHRLVMAAEKKFFDKCDTGHVPVIVLLTKADTLNLDAVQELVKKGMRIDDAIKGAADVEKRLVNDCLVRVEGWLKKLNFPPKAYLSLTGMQSEGTECTPLLTCTANALTEEGLQQLLISTQQSNLQLCMEFAIMKTLKDCMNRGNRKLPSEAVAFKISRWFPYKYEDELEFLRRALRGTTRELAARGLGGSEQFALLSRLLSLREEEHDELRRILRETMREEEMRFLERERRLLEESSEREELLRSVDDHLVPSIFSPTQSLKIPPFSTSMQYSRQYIAENGIGAILVFEYLYFLLQVKSAKDDIQEDLNLAVEEYQSSGILAKVNKLIQEAFQNHGDDVETLCPILVKITQQNQLSKMLDRKG